MDGVRPGSILGVLAGDRNIFPRLPAGTDVVCSRVDDDERCALL